MNAAGASVKFMVCLSLSRNVDNGTNVGIREQQQGRLVADVGHPAMCRFPAAISGHSGGSIPDVDEAERSSTCKHHRHSCAPSPVKQIDDERYELDLNRLRNGQY